MFSTASDYGDLPSWYYSPLDALKYRNVKKHPHLKYFHDLANKTFKRLCDEDALIKPDVERIYQLSIDGKMQTSINNGKTSWDGGLMDYPSMPVVDVVTYTSSRSRGTFEYLAQQRGGKTSWSCSISGEGFSYKAQRLVRTKPVEEELYKGSFRLKPVKPVKPIDWSGVLKCPAYNVWKTPLIDEFDWECDFKNKKHQEYLKALEKYKIELENWRRL